ncbi:MAG TPA: preprotein translocase subunit SecE [Candidatus Limnocylindrales bacterium]|nr:preprotein translocase subunit SecE [Candidatus Limnocylindrales bacterium]
MAATGQTQNEPTSPRPGPTQWVTQGRTFADEAVNELKRVYWPSRKETQAFTWVVLIVVLVVSAYLGAIDYMLSLVMRVAFNR